MGSASRSATGTRTSLLAIALFLALAVSLAGCAGSWSGPGGSARDALPVQLGPRPFYLLDQLDPGPLRTRLEACREGPFRRSRFSLGHRGAPLQFPEHSRASYRAAAILGAGKLECDVTFTKDRVLVCRHAQCDLATTTDILTTPLAERCEVPFTPATETTAAMARCCTHAFTYEELQTLDARMDTRNAGAAEPAQYASGPRAFRTDLYSTGQRILTHAESVALFDALGVDMTPELKTPQAEMPFEGDYSLEDYARQLVDTYLDAGIPPERVRMQSFDPDVIRIWLEIAPEYGAQAVWLLGDPEQAEALDHVALDALHAEGFRTLAPPVPMLLTVDDDGQLAATDFARRARATGFALVAWTLERSGRIREGRVEGRPDDYYLGPILSTLENDGDLYRVIQALHEEVGVEAIFSDWPAAVTYYANCMGLD